MVPREMKLEEADGDVWIKYCFPTGGKTRSPRGALANFLTLADETTTIDHLLKFAQQWGVLCICGHNFVATHNQKCFPRCDEPLYSELTDLLESGGDSENSVGSMTPMETKMRLVEVDVWFREPLSIWIHYARQMRALINVFRRLRGDGHSNTLEDWNILRQIEFPVGNDRMQSVVQLNEDAAHAPIHQMSHAQQCGVLGNILSMWLGESYFVPRFEWTFPEAKASSSALAANCTLNATYRDVNLFASDHLTLFSVLVAQCISALGPDPFFRQCNCIGCGAHKGNCQELIELSLTPGRPSVYCDLCRPYIRQQQKSASRKKNKKERSNQHE